MSKMQNQTPVSLHHTAQGTMVTFSLLSGGQSVKQTKEWGTLTPGELEFINKRIAEKTVEPSVELWKEGESD